MDVHSQLLVWGIDRKAWAHGWIWSVVSHAIVVTTLVMSVQSIQVEQETFQWNIDIVSSGSFASQPAKASTPSVEAQSSKESVQTSLQEDASLGRRHPPCDEWSTNRIQSNIWWQYRRRDRIFRFRRDPHPWRVGRRSRCWNLRPCEK